MSSTNRSNARESHVADYYVTPVEAIKDFLIMFKEDEKLLLQLRISLDPCAGGDVNHEMSYPRVLNEYVFQPVITLDIREDSNALIKCDYLLYDTDKNYYDLIITNPPFNIAQQIIEKAMGDVKEGGYVVMLLRLNYMGSQQRKEFWEKYPPYRIYVHRKRMSFQDGGGTDSIEYAHFVWKKGYQSKEALLKII